MKNYTHHNNELRKNHINENVYLKGWVAKKRNLGGLIFIDLRDRFGITQLVVRPESPSYEEASSVKSEYLIEAKGIVKLRESVNPQLPTGEIEVDVLELSIINTSKIPPFTISDKEAVSEEVALKYRYLDLRRPLQQQYILKRSEITKNIRHSLEDLGFLELETPYLVKTTPEGAKEFLVPSRLYHGEAYALAQSPQIFKQLYMVAGFERYFQIARCFRDEDLRSDRQLEFTQVDIEASFVDQDDIMSITEKVIENLMKLLNKNIKFPLKRMSYKEAFDSYGSDKPDIRYELKIENFNDTFKGFEIPIFKDKVLRGFTLENNALFTRKYFDKLTEEVKKNHGDTLAYLKLENGQLSGSISKFVNATIMKENTVMLIIPGTYDGSTQAAGAIRKTIARDLGMIDESKDELLWVTDFPLLEYDETENRFYAKHHPFTSPKDANELKNNPKDALAKAYDLVWNGYEVGGGSIRIYDQEVQMLMFETLGFTEEQIKEKFGFFVEALQYGTPPHGGIALGLDRIVMLATKTENIKDVVAFPKTQSAKDLMMMSPSKVDEVSLKELGLKVE